MLIDLPGHGESEAPLIEYSHEHFANAIATVLSQEKVSQAVLVGFSMGGPVSTMFLRLYPERVAGIIYVDSFFHLPEQYLTMQERKEHSEGLSDDSYFKAKIEGLFSVKTTPDTRDDVLRTMMTTPKHVRTNATTTNCMHHAWRSEEIFDCPALLLVCPIFAELDRNWRYHLPKLEVNLWRENGHFLFMEDPKRFHAEVFDFLDRHRLLLLYNQNNAE